MSEANKYWSVAAERHLLLESLVSVTPQQLAPDEEEAPTYQTRLLAMTGTHLRIERPTDAGAEARLQPGAAVNVVFAEGAERWAVTATVESTITRTFNDDMTMQVVTLIDIRNPKSAQRREFFRAPTHGDGYQVVEFTPHRVDTFLDQNGKESNFRTFGGKIINISGGGVGILTTSPVSEQFDHCRMYTARLMLDDDEDLVTVVVELRHHHQVPGVRKWYVGFRFAIDDPAEERRFSERMCQVTTRLQHLQLKRRYTTRHPLLVFEEDG